MTSAPPQTTNERDISRHIIRQSCHRVNVRHGGHATMQGVHLCMHTCQVHMHAECDPPRTCVTHLLTHATTHSLTQYLHGMPCALSNPVSTLPLPNCSAPFTPWVSISCIVSSHRTRPSTCTGGGRGGVGGRRGKSTEARSCACVEGVWW